MRAIADRRAVLIAVDSTAAFFAVIVGVRLRFGADASVAWEGVLGLPPVPLMAAYFGVLTFLCFASAGIYRREAYWSRYTELLDFFKGLALLGSVTLGLLYLFKFEDVSRLVLVFAFASVSLVGIGVRSILRRSIRAAALRGQSLRHWLVVGNGPRVSEMVDLVKRHPQIGAQIEGIVGPTAMSTDKVPWLGGIEDLPEILSRNVIDEVIIVFDAADWVKLEGVIAACTEQGKTVRMPLDAIAPTILRGRFEEFDGVPMWSVLATSEHDLALAVKRIIDVVISSALLLLLSPVLIITALTILVGDGRPIFFRQPRGGLHGRPFQMLKFRTMVNGAEGMRGDLLTVNERTGPVFKMRNDPRVTKFGRWLRKSSIDELPQLANVFAGHMSLVGPRPQPMEEVVAYDLWHRRRLSMRPGITGLWQVEARNDPSFDTWMDRDLEYIDQWSLVLDFSILARTPAATFRTPGS
jgi:exopolysaccharide biosynthesis polyprenyl glycosylphosphotransferase